MKTDRGTPTLALANLLSRYFGAARFAYNSSTDSISITQPQAHWLFPVWGSDRRVLRRGKKEWDRLIAKRKEREARQMARRQHLRTLALASRAPGVGFVIF